MADHVGTSFTWWPLHRLKLGLAVAVGGGDALRVAVHVS
jgi:hypothetical protein